MPEEQRCTLCDLPLADSRVSDPEIEGTFCCRGCLEAYRLLEEDPHGAAADHGRTAPEGDGRRSLEETFLDVEGMHCSSCERYLETVARRHRAVGEAAASYASGMMRVRYDPGVLGEADLPDLVSGTGYRARLAGSTPEERGDEAVARLVLGGFFAMMTMAWYLFFLYPAYLGWDAAVLEPGGSATTYLLANCAVMSAFVLGYTGFPIMRGAWVSLRVGEPNMDLLVALAASSAFAYSTVALFLGRTELYFDVVVAVVMVVSLGDYYQERIRRRALGRLEDLTRERSDRARVRSADGDEEVRPVSEVGAGQQVLVREGERVPLDGRLVEGRVRVDESLLTGESRPAEKEPGDRLMAGTVVTAHAGRIEVDDPPRSTVDRLARLVWNSQAGRAGPQRLADRIARVFVPGTLGAALVGGSVHAFLGASFTASLLTALTVLVVACPCALGLATPLAVVAGVRDGLERGIVVRDVSVFERIAEIGTVVLDKTGTLTVGQMRLFEKGDRSEALTRARALERQATHPASRARRAAHPAARAIAAGSTGSDGAPDRGAERSSPAPEVTEFRSHDRGVRGRVDGVETAVGHESLFAELGWEVPQPLIERASTARAEAHLAVLVGWDGAARDVLVLGDRLRSGWERVTDRLAEEADLVLLTGDSEEAAEPLRRTGRFDRVFADVRPEGKRALVQTLGREGPVAMVGDGINDAPALAEADVGVGFGPTALAADSAHLVVVRRDLDLLPEAFRLARRTRTRIRQNLGWAFCYNAVAVPLALAGVLNPFFAAAAMSASSILVVANSTRRV